MLREEATVEPMEEAGGGRSGAPPSQRLLEVSERTRSTMLIWWRPRIVTWTWTWTWTWRPGVEWWFVYV